MKGGKATRTAKAGAPVPVGTIAELQRHVGQVLADVLLLQNSERRATAAARLIMAAAKLIEESETRALLEELRDEVMRLKAMEATQ